MPSSVATRSTAVVGAVAAQPHPGPVVVSNGFGKFALAAAAAEAHQRSYLAALVTGAYPTPRVNALLRRLKPLQVRKLRRLLDREEMLTGAHVRTLWFAEFMHQVARRASSIRAFRRPAHHLDVAAMRRYGRQAATAVMDAPRGGIYHYRSGFGHISVTRAKERGMVALCDHSIAHPSLLGFLVENEGRLPPEPLGAPTDPLWREVLHDLERADAVLVNSAFVKETFVRQGWNPQSVHVIYWGVDDTFLRAVPPREGDTREAELRLAFAGSIDRRKGAHVLLDALALLPDVPWRLELFGAVAPDIRRSHGRLLESESVRLAGTLRRHELARALAATDVFVFPSLAEGSARVVFEALACGCYVVTTPNAGSIVEDGVHGALVPPGDPEALAAAIRGAEAARDRVADIGRSNARAVRQRYRQEHYGASLAALYVELLRRREETA